MSKTLWTIAALATALSVGCGTVVNVTNLDDQGREAFGGATRDIRLAFHPLDNDAAGLKTLLGMFGGDLKEAMIFLPLVAVGYVGCLAIDTTFSIVGDACTLPFLPLLDRRNGSGPDSQASPATLGTPVPAH